MKGKIWGLPLLAHIQPSGEWHTLPFYLTLKKGSFEGFPLSCSGLLNLTRAPVLYIYLHSLQQVLEVSSNITPFTDERTQRGEETT